MRIPYLLLIFPLPSPCLFPLSFSLPLRNHFVTTLLPSSTFPVPCYLSSALAIVRRVNILLLLCSTDSRLATLDSPLSATCLVLGDNPPSKKSQENAIFLANPQILLYLCTLYPTNQPNLTNRTNLTNNTNI